MHRLEPIATDICISEIKEIKESKAQTRVKCIDHGGEKVEPAAVSCFWPTCNDSRWIIHDHNLF